MKKLLSGILSAAFILSCCTPVAAVRTAKGEQEFETNVGYSVSVTQEEREIIHAEVDKLGGDVGDMVVGDGSYDPLTLVGGLATGSDYDSISYGSRAAGSVPTEYPFAVPNTEANNNEYDRKSAKLAWVEQLAEDLGFPVVVHRQDDKYVYVEIGDPDAPEMVMALSHLDSPTASNNAAQLERWRNADGEVGTDPTAYHTPYVQDGWLYGAGVQDDSGPTLATLFAAKALMEAGLPLDRRIRIVMGAYEDSNPGVPSVQDTLNYMNIPYYDRNPSFYDNWAYKSLNREETPIAGYTSDSRFPVVVGNSKALTPTIAMSLAGDDGKAFALLDAGAGVTLREGDDTLKDIVYGSTSQIASRAVFTLNADGAKAEDIDLFLSCIEDAAEEQGWLPAADGETPKVQVTYTATSGTIVLEVNTDVAMEMPTPQYGKNAVVWGMYLISAGLDAVGGEAAALQLKDAADGIVELFFQDQVEGEAYIGKYMGIPTDLLRNPDSGVANLTFALMGGIRNTEDLVSFYTDENVLSIPLYIRSMFTNEEDYNTALEIVVDAWHDQGFTWQENKLEEGQFTAYSNPTLYTSHDNLLVALQMASYKATMESDPEAFSDVYDLLDISYPVGTTGGTLASNFRNKMTAFGAVIPGNERWWHSANERIKVDSIIEMTKMMADGMLEMARYSGPAGAQLMWADIPGLNTDRADLDLLDVTVGTYQDASDKLEQVDLDGGELLAATDFNIPMWSNRGNTSPTAAAFEAGHGEGGVYLSTDDPDFQANTFVLPMRLEFKVERPDGMSDEEWEAVRDGGIQNFSFYILKDGEQIPLTLSGDEAENADKYFSTRVSAYDEDSVYVSVNLAITDGEYSGVDTVLADSKTDLYSLNEEYLANHENPFPERGAVEERGFFLFGDGSKDAEFTSPDAIYVTLAPEEATLTFTYPESIVESEVSVELYKGYPTSASYTLDNMISRGQLTEMEPNADGTYTVTEAGTYSYHISGEGYYNILKLVNITEGDLAYGSVEIEVVGGPLGSNDGQFGDGYQPTVKPSAAPDSYKMDARDAMLVIWTDEILEHFTTENTTHDYEYTTPAFDGTDAANEFTTQEELMEFLADRDAKCSYMRLYSAGSTPNYGFDIPLAVFTQTKIPADASLEEAAALVSNNGKPTVWYQAQIHPNEPASGEGALVVVDRFINDPETAALLENINLVVVPRINPDGSYLFSRATYDGFDMNRDHMSLKADELAQLHTAYRLFMAEVVIDGHEFTFYGASTDKENGEGYMSNSYDLETTPATSLNDDPAVTAMALEMCAETFDNAREAGLRVYHYGTTVNNPIGRAYFGLYNCLSFLVETRGIGAGKTNFERRVFSHETAIMSYITYTAEHADEVKEVVAQARANTIAKGATYDEDDILALYQTKSGQTVTEYVGYKMQYYMDGTLKICEPETLSLNDTITRGRVRPTAYVIPADAENIDKILYIMDNQGAEYYELPAGATATLEQYYYVGPYMVNGRATGIEADLREATSVTFENGAYAFPMDQVAANVIAMLVEPDVTDSNGYDGTLYQYGVVTYDETTLNFPLYRYTGNDPRTTLIGLKDTSGQGGSGSTSTTYAIVVEDADNGSVKSSLSRAVKGATVVLTVKPDEGYELDELVVTDSKGNELKLTDRGDGKYAFTMPAAKVTVEAFFTKTAAEPEQPTAPAMSFVDVSEKDWFYNAVAYAYENGLMSGTSATTFAPNDKLTRAMVAQILYNLEGTPAVSGTQFTDVAAGMWYTNAITWAAQNGLVSGYGDGKFGPNDLVTREQLAVILNHYAEFKKMTATATGSLAAFTDGATASDWAVNALIWAVDNGVMAGKGNSTLDPKGTATRAEVAQMFMNFLEA